MSQHLKYTFRIVIVHEQYPPRDLKVWKMCSQEMQNGFLPFHLGAVLHRSDSKVTDHFAENKTKGHKG